MAIPDFNDNPEEASKGGFQGIKKIRGILAKMERVDPRFTDTKYGKPKDTIEVTLTNAAVLEMANKEEEPELRDNEFKFWIPYAEPGVEKPSANSIFTKCWAATALEAYKKRASELQGEYVTLERRRVVLFKTDKGEDNKPLPLNEDGSKQYREVATDKYFCFVPDVEDSGDYTEQIIAKVLGKPEKVAARAVLMDGKVQQHPEFRDAVRTGTLAQLLGLELKDGVYTKASE